MAGVSPAVVSYVLNNGPRPVSAGARERVNAAIAELSYRPNQVARALRANRSRSIGLLLPDALNPFFGDLANKIEEYCLKRGYLLFVGTTNNDPALERHYLQSFEDRQVDGLVVVSTGAGDEQPSTRLPHVYIDRSPTPSSATGSSSSAERTAIAGGREATLHLLEHHNRRRLLLIGGPENLAGTAGRVTGALEAVESVKGASAVLRHAGFDYQSGYEVTRQVLRDRADRIDAIFALSDVQAIGAMRACADLGAAVPDDVSLVSYDGTELTQFTTPRLTAIAQDVDRMVSTALTELLERIGDVFDDQHPTVESERPQLRLGESCGCRITAPRGR